MTPPIDLSRAIRLHKQARGSAPSLDACALIVEMIAHVERHRVPAADVEPLILAALLEGAALAKAAYRLGCVPGDTGDSVTVALFARPIVHALVDDLLYRRMLAAHLREAQAERQSPEEIAREETERLAAAIRESAAEEAHTEGFCSLGEMEIAYLHGRISLATLRAGQRVFGPDEVRAALVEEIGAEEVARFEIVIGRDALTLDTGESPEADGALGRALDLLAEDVAADVIGQAGADLAAEPKLRRPRCPLDYVDAEDNAVPCGRPEHHKGDCGPAKPSRKAAR